MKLDSIIESLLIASEEPLTADQMARSIRLAVSDLESDLADHAFSETQILELEQITETEILKVISSLNERYSHELNSYLIVERTKGWRVFVKPQFSIFVKQLYPTGKPQRLSGPAMETLAIIAYRQPITKAAMEAVRGVSCDGMIQKLLDRELICISGRAELPGRPLLYQTTDSFFEHFGIKSVDELPNSNELRTKKISNSYSEQIELTMEQKQPHPSLDSDFDNQESRSSS